MHLKGCAPGFCYQENVAAPKQVEQAYHILKAEGLSPETSRYLLESNGYRLGDTSQLSSLLDDGEEDLLQREEVKGRAVEEFETESDELEEKKVEFPERGISMEVIEFDKEHAATSEKELLPNAEKAILTEEKFTGYFLDPNHKVGGNKALVFEKVLGYNKENWSELRSQIQQGLLKYRSTEGLTDQYGKRFEVRMIIKGPTGRYAKVKTGWIVDSGGNCPRIISAYIYK